MICISGGFSISMLVYWMLPPLVWFTPRSWENPTAKLGFRWLFQSLVGGLLLSVAIDGGIYLYLYIYIYSYSDYQANIESFAEYHRLMYWRLAMAMVCSHPNPRNRPSSDPQRRRKSSVALKNHWAV